MKKFYAAKLLGALAAVGVSWTADAIPVVVNSNLSAMRVSSGPDKIGTFDVNAAAATLGFAPGYTISGATVSFSFADNGSFGFGDSGDTVTETRTYTNSQLVSLPPVCGSTISSCTYPKKIVDYYGVNQSNPIETASVTIDAQTASASSNHTTNIAVGAEVPIGSTSCGILGCGFVPETRSWCGDFLGATICEGPYPVSFVNTYLYDTYGGGFSINFALDSASLADLAADGLLSFALGSLAGDFNFHSASLTADIIGGGATTGPEQPPVSVAEPTSLSLFALGVIGAMRRRVFRIVSN